MKQKFNYFFNEAPYWQVALGIFIFTELLYFIFYPLVSSETFNFHHLLIVSTPMCILMTLITMLGISAGRGNSKFWAEADRLEKLVNSTENRDELERILNEDFENFYYLSSHPMHYTEVEKIKAIIDTKLKYIK